jgi:RNA polymerase sigma-70 factor (ECF subfamily)
MDSENFTTIVAQFYEPVYRFALSLTRAEADACDLTQQTFYVWAVKSHQLRDQSKAKAWLFTTLHRAFLETHKRQVRFPHQDLDQIPVHDIPVSSPDMAKEMDAPQVLSALARVDRVYQAAVALFYLEDCSYNEIAEVLGIPVGTVKSRIARGIGQLRRLYGFTRSAPSPASEGSRREGLLEEDVSSDSYHSQLDS